MSPRWIAVTQADMLLRLRRFLLESIAQAADEIKKIDDILNEAKECR
jgi:hypothetical protein